jgi:hypothetical protein
MHPLVKVLPSHPLRAYQVIRRWRCADLTIVLFLALEEYFLLKDYLPLRVLTRHATFSGLIAGVLLDHVGST